MNRLISRLILSFVAASLTVTLLPLLESGTGIPMVPVVGRGDSLSLYAGFLLVFVLFVLPAFMAADARPGRVLAWATIVAYVLLFASIPLVFTAYISGVGARALVTVAALCAAGAGFPLLATRFLPPRVAPFLSWLLGSALLFAVPVLDRYLASVGRKLSEEVAALAPHHWIDQITRLHAVPDPAPFLVLAVLLWMAAILPSLLRRRRRAAVAGGAMLALVLAGGAVVPPVQQAAQVESLAGGVARAGLRTPLRVTLPRGEGDAIVGLGGERHRLPRDGSPHVILAVPGADPRRIRIEAEGRVDEVPFPAEVVPPESVLLGWIPGSSGGRIEPGAWGLDDAHRLVELDGEELPPHPGALEAFDIVIAEAGRTPALRPDLQEALRRYAALGGRLVLVEEGASQTVERHGLGTITRLSAPGLPALLPSIPRPLRAPAIDRDLLGTFVPPHWQEMDLSALVLFAVLYHLAFLLAFLLPLLLDSRKALGVYLASVGFVVIVIAVGAYHVLGTIFLRDNQVYTQAITVIVADRGPEPFHVARQFLGFASMSGETRKLGLEGADDVTLVRPDAAARLPLQVRTPGGVVLEDAELDRFQGKLMVRIDRTGPAPLRIVETPGGLGAFRLEPVEGAPDPLGLRTARVAEAFTVEGGRWTRRFRADGRDLVDVGPTETWPAADAAEVLYRRLVGHYVPPLGRHLVIRFAELLRPDGGAGYLWRRDLGGYLLFPLGEG